MREKAPDMGIPYSSPFPAFWVSFAPRRIAWQNMTALEQKASLPEQTRTRRNTEFILRPMAYFSLIRPRSAYIPFFLQQSS